MLSFDILQSELGMDFFLCLFSFHPFDLITPIKLGQDTYNEVPPHKIFSLKQGNYYQLEKGAESGKLQELAITCCIYGIFRGGILQLLPN
jgi:hypothetical protein